jgi:uncharacterized hydrophobic protein (TIGR00271 family)
VSKLPPTLRGAITRAQNRAATALGVDEAARAQTVVAMLANNARRAPGYWIQLVLAAGIATLGLVLNSTAVVIGAMLVSPLMGPIVEFGMGLAVGSSLLAVRAAIRVVFSIVVAVGVATLLTEALPFHEITAEISARTAPTALDLFVAMFCALTAAYTTVRPGTDSTAAAAGTAVGIALVPPLCTIGFGLGTGALDVAGGAALLFTANLSAILVLSVLSFLALGFHQVEATALEHDFLDLAEAGGLRRGTQLYLRLREAFGSRYGVVIRLLVPIAFLAAVYVPLRKALDDVTWEVRARDTARRVVREAAPRAVQTQVVVERRTLSLRLLIVGSPARAAALERQLAERIGRIIGDTPSVTVVAVPNAQTLATERAAEARAIAAPAPPAVDALRARAGAALIDAWPPGAGALLGWELALPARDSVRLTVLHAGAPLGDPAEQLLARALTATLATPVAIRGVALPAVPIVATSRGARAWLDSARVVLAEVARTDSAVACIRGPVAVAERSAGVSRTVLRALRQFPSLDSTRVIIRNGTRWEISVARGACTEASGTPARGGG